MQILNTLHMSAQKAHGSGQPRVRNANGSFDKSMCFLETFHLELCAGDNGWLIDSELL